MRIVVLSIGDRVRTHGSPAPQISLASQQKERKGRKRWKSTVELLLSLLERFGLLGLLGGPWAFFPEGFSSVYRLLSSSPHKSKSFASFTCPKRKYDHHRGEKHGIIIVKGKLIAFPDLGVRLNTTQHRWNTTTGKRRRAWRMTALTKARFSFGSEKSENWQELVKRKKKRWH